MDQPTATTGEVLSTNFFRIIGYACFLGCSWTWVIGLFLPGLLVRDYGLSGWFVFAIPNVLGAAALGFMLARPRTSRDVCEKHAGAMIRFSDVTIAYHVFVAGWLLQIDLVVVLGLAAILIWTLLWRKSSWDGPVSAAVAIISVMAFAVVFRERGGAVLVEPMFSSSTDVQPRLDWMALLLFIPASLTGFLLCPYLDLTFHRVRQALTPAAGRIAFALGFGVVFLVMIIFSLACYHLFGASPRIVFSRDWVAGCIAVHVVLQMAFTFAVHLREITCRRGHAGLHRTFSYMICGGAMAFWAVSDDTTRYFDLPIGEVVYRVFLLFYGLVFPAYVWLWMIPYRCEPVKRIRLIVYTLALAAALPLGFYYFVAASSWLIVPVLFILAAARGVLMLTVATRPGI